MADATPLDSALESSDRAGAAALAPSRPLPVGVISTDAIEQLSPFVPAEATRPPRRVWRLPESRRQERSAARRRERASSVPFGGHFQSLITAAPLAAGDLLAIALSFAVSVGFASLLVGAFEPVLAEVARLVITAAVTYGALGLYFGLFPATAISPVLELRQLTVSALLGGVLVATVATVFTTAGAAALATFVAGWTLALMGLPLMRAIVRHHFRRYAWWGERAIVIGSGVQGRAIYNFYLRAAQRGLRPVGIVDQSKDPPVETVSNYSSGGPNGRPLSPSAPIPYLGGVRQLARLARRHSARWGIVAPGGCDGMDMLQVVNCAGALPHLVILPSQYALPSLWASPCECAGVMGVHVNDRLRGTFSPAFKRAIDIAGAGLGLIAALPLLAVIVCLVKCLSPGPVFHTQTRVGKGGRVFKLWKIRTMVTDAEEILDFYIENDPEIRRQWMEDQKLKDDPRIIRGIGDFLRKTSLDELPQLWNVLRGDMSLVGPRPLLSAADSERYGEMYPLHRRVRPGLTGLWQISGRNDTSFDQRVRLDSYYVCNWSIWLDLYILIRTFRTVLLREGAY